MTHVTLAFRKIAVLTAFILMAAVYSPVTAGSIADREETAVYTGRIVSHNERTGEIVFKAGRSRHHWRLGRRVVAYYGRDRVQLPVVWHRSRDVRVYVSRDGEVQRIIVLSWR